MQVPASIGILQISDLNRYAPTSLVPSLNSIPGTRMEERSPGSYRLSMRGSLLRSPFGVRNVKVYWNDLPFTDAGGNTYLNLVDLNTLGGIEIIRGPAGSIYGANTGGVVVLRSRLDTLSRDPQGKSNSLSAGITGGSYGLFAEHLAWRGGGKKVQWQITQAHQQSDGYRENSSSRRDVVQGDLLWKTGDRNLISALLLYSDLYYKTPGGLTQKQLDADPRMARPATPATPSASAQHASVRNRSLIAGATDEFRISDSWNLTLSSLFSHTDFRNPFITNYEKRDEKNLSLRTKLVHSGSLGNTPYKWLVGAEWDHGWYRIDSTGNNGGTPDGNLVRDRVNALQAFLFTQVEWEPFRNLLVQAGVSLNHFRYDLERIIGQPMVGKVPIDFNNRWVPRVALLFHPYSTWSMHASVSKGFSPPSIAEVRPSAGGFRTDLQAEYGWSWETGLKLSIIHNRLQVDLTAFRFDLQQAIARRTNSSGSEYFINSGGTRQSGIEAWIEGYPWLNTSSRSFQSLKLWSSITLSDFHFKDYKSGNTDYSGKELTGVPRQQVVTGMDLSFLIHCYLSSTFSYTGRIPLTDANDVYAGSYSLWQFKAGWKGQVGRTRLDVFAGVDNAGNVLYSLGNDLNAFGKRYFNPAPGRNFYAGTVIRL